MLHFLSLSYFLATFSFFYYAFRVFFSIIFLILQINILLSADREICTKIRLQYFKQTIAIKLTAFVVYAWVHSFFHQTQTLSEKGMRMYYMCKCVSSYLRLAFGQKITKSETLQQRAYCNKMLHKNLKYSTITCTTIYLEYNCWK